MACRNDEHHSSAWQEPSNMQVKSCTAYALLCGWLQKGQAISYMIWAMIVTNTALAGGSNRWPAMQGWPTCPSSDGTTAVSASVTESLDISVAAPALSLARCASSDGCISYNERCRFLHPKQMSKCTNVGHSCLMSWICVCK